VKLASIAGLLALPSALGAQVGYSPERSPYRDLNTAMRMSVIAGWYSAADDAAGVLPKSGPLVGVRWLAHVGGPAEIGVRLAMVSTERSVLDPAQEAENRLVETRDVRLGFGDVTLNFNLTGSKSWRNLAPYIQAGIGLVSDFESRDVGGFRHGTEFAFSYGAGVRFVPARRFELHAELGSYFYNLEYPTTYFVPGPDETSVLPAAAKRDAWRNNWTLAIGASFHPFR
jgi:hypothetical protein